MEELDQVITLYINSLNSGITDWIWMTFSNKFIWFPFYLLVLVFIFKRLGWKKGGIVALSLVLMVLATDQFANLIKNSVCRYRPSHNEWMLQNGLHLLEDAGSMFGFYSAHAANSFGFAVTSLMGFRNDKSRKYNGYAWCVFIWASMVAISRVFAGKHFLGDVLVGIVAGLIFGYIFGFIARKIITSLES